MASNATTPPDFVANPVVERILGHASRADGSASLTLVDAHGGARSFSLPQLVARAGEWTRRYRASGLERGAKVVVILEHGEALYVSYLGALLGGYCPAYFAHPSDKVDEARYCASVRTLLGAIGGDFVVSSRAILDRLKLQVPHGLYEDGTAFGAPAAARSVAATSPPLFLQFSSGTTGLKKGVAITAEALLWQIDRYAERMNVGKADRIASWLPLYHDMGLIACFFLPLLKGIPVAAISPFDWVRTPGMLFDVVTRHRSTLMWLPNFAFNFLAARAKQGNERWDLSSLRSIVNCSEPVLDESHRIFVRRFRECGLRDNAITTCYAMAENTFAMTSCSPGKPPVVEFANAAEFAPGKRVAALAESAPGAKAVVSSGTALPDVRVTIRDEARNELRDGHIGEIAISSPCLFTGYFGNAEETALRHRDGVFYTGDLGYRRNGELFVIGRISDTIIVAGRNIFPQDIEAAINDIEGVIAGRVVAFGVDDAALGTQDLVIVAETALSDAQSRSALRKRIRHAAVAQTDVVPADIVLTEPRWLQKSTSGKLSRALNRQRYCDAKALDFDAGEAVIASEDAGSVIDGVRACVTDSIKASGARIAPAFGDDDDLLREGIFDSFSYVGFQLALEDRFGAAAVRAIRENPGTYRSVNEIASMLGGASASPNGNVARAGSAEARSQSGKYALAPQMHDVEAQPYEWFAYLMRRGAPDYHSTTLNSDEHGFRFTHRDGKVLGYTAFLNAKGRKAAVLGNSFAYGIGATHDSKTFTSCLNALESSRAYLWYNFAQRASVLRQERLALELFAPDLPDCVVWVSGINNLISLLVGDGVPGNPAPFVGERQFAARMMPERRYAQVPAPQQRYQEMMKQLEIDIASVALRLRGKGRLLFCLQPAVSWLGKDLTAEEKSLIDIFDSAGSPLQQAHSPEYLAPLHTQFSDGVEEICRRWGADYIDCNLDSRLEKREWLFLDRTHMTDRGHAVMAEMIAEWIKEHRDA